jgi:hypothetical protein
MKHRRRRLVLLSGCFLAVLLLIWLLHAGATEPIDSYLSCAADGNPVSDTSPSSCRADGHVFLGPPETPAQTIGAGDLRSSVDFELLVEGDSGGNYPEQKQVIQNQADWEKFWREVHAGLPSLPPILPVDFSKSSVVALTYGRQQTDGYNLKVNGITASATGSTVDVIQSVPTITCKVMARPTNRYFLARAPKLQEPVVFRITTQHRRCSASILDETD